VRKTHRFERKEKIILLLLMFFSLIITHLFREGNRYANRNETRFSYQWGVMVLFIYSFIYNY